MTRTKTFWTKRVWSRIHSSRLCSKPRCGRSMRWYWRGASTWRITTSISQSSTVRARTRRVTRSCSALEVAKRTSSSMMRACSCSNWNGGLCHVSCTIWICSCRPYSFSWSFYGVSHNKILNSLLNICCQIKLPIKIIGLKSITLLIKVPCSCPF